MYTAHPLLPSHVQGASIDEIKWWLDLPAPVAKALHAHLEQLSDVTLDSIAVALRASVLAASNAGEAHVEELRDAAAVVAHPVSAAVLTSLLRQVCRVLC